MTIADFFSAESLAVLGEVVVIDLALAGDNAVVVGALAAGLPQDKQRKVILFGTLAALVLRILFALVATYLLNFVGILTAGGLLLLWVAWKMWRELRHHGMFHVEQSITDPESSIVIARGVRAR